MIYRKTYHLGQSQGLVSPRKSASVYERVRFTWPYNAHLAEVNPARVVQKSALREVIRCSHVMLVLKGDSDVRARPQIGAENSIVTSGVEILIESLQLPTEKQVPPLGRLRRPELKLGTTESSVGMTIALVLTADC